MILRDPALAYQQLVDQFANVEHFIMQVVRNHFGEIQQKVLQKCEELCLASLTGFGQDC